MEENPSLGLTFTIHPWAPKGSGISQLYQFTDMKDRFIDDINKAANDLRNLAQVCRCEFLMKIQEKPEQIPGKFLKHS